MSNLELIKYISPPAEPIDMPTSNVWSDVERELGIVFPSDYKLFINTYGNGLLGDFYYIWNPYYEEEFIKQVKEITRIEQASKDEFPKYYPYDIYPNKPGFLPCMSDDNGNYYGWYTEGQPDTWPILTHEVRGDGFKLHSLSLTGYLVGVFSGAISPLAGDYPRENDYIFEQQKSA